MSGEQELFESMNEIARLEDEYARALIAGNRVEIARTEKKMEQARKAALVLANERLNRS